MASRVTPAGSQVLGTPIPISFGNGVAGGCIGYIERDTNAGPVSSGTAADIGAMSFAFTPSSASRLIELEFWCSYVTASDTTTYGMVAIQEGVNVLSWARTGLTLAGVGVGPAVVVKYLWHAPSASAHTIKATLARAGGAGSVTVAASADSKMYLRAVDLGLNF